ncbi:hypothetical protein Tco_0537942 [Tanacetum coccineum]
MPLKSTHMTQAAIHRMIKESVDAVIAAERARQANFRNDASGSRPVRGQDTAPAVRECTFAGFMKCNPAVFCGIEGMVVEVVSMAVLLLELVVRGVMMLSAVTQRCLQDICENRKQEMREGFGEGSSKKCWEQRIKVEIVVFYSPCWSVYRLSANCRKVGIRLKDDCPGRFKQEERSWISSSRNVLGIVEPKVPNVVNEVSSGRGLVCHVHDSGLSFYGRRQLFDIPLEQKLLIVESEQGCVSELEGHIRVSRSCFDVTLKTDIMDPDYIEMEMQIPRSSIVKFIATCSYSRLNDFKTSRKNDPKLPQTLISTSSSVCQSDEVMN